MLSADIHKYCRFSLKQNQIGRLSIEYGKVFVEYKSVKTPFSAFTRHFYLLCMTCLYTLNNYNRNPEPLSKIPRPLYTLLCSINEISDRCEVTAVLLTSLFVCPTKECVHHPGFIVFLP